MFITNPNAVDKLNEYLNSAGISSQELMEITNGNFLIFGGAIRDAIAGEESCKDIDIVVGVDLANKSCFKYWKDFQFVHNEKLYQYKYANRTCIIHTNTFPTRIYTPIDLIFNENSHTLMGMLNIIKNVDINVNGIAWHPSANFMEIIPDAIKFCERKVFYVNKKAAGYNQARIDERIKKLTNNGWLKVVVA